MFKCCSHRKVTRLSPSEHIYETPLPMFSIRDRVSSPPIPPPRRTRLILDDNGNLYPPSNLIYRNSNLQMINHSNSNETRFLAQCRGTDNDAFSTTDKSQFIVHHNDAPNLDFRYGSGVDKSAPHGSLIK